MDLIIKNAYLHEFNKEMDIGIKGNKIEKIEKNIDVDSSQTIDAKGNLVTPGLVDAHTHLEKALTIDGTESCNLLEAINTFDKRCETISKEDIKNRAGKVLDMAIKNGTSALRTHIIVDDQIKLMGIEALTELKDEYKDLIDLQIVAMAQIEGEEINQENLRLLDKAGTYNIDLYGASPSICHNPEGQIDYIYELAKKHDLDIDLHCDETDQPIVTTLKYIVDKTIEEGMEGRVTASHCVALSYLGHDEAKILMQKMKDADIDVITLPSCNVYLMAREEEHPKTRGLTRVDELIELGIKVAVGSDNIQDPFRPFGNADMLEEALFTAQILQMGTITQLETIYNMVTYDGADILKLKKYGLEEGCFADLIIYDAKTIDEAIVTQSNKSYIIKNGKIIVENRHEVIKNY